MGFTLHPWQLYFLILAGWVKPSTFRRWIREEEKCPVTECRDRQQGHSSRFVSSGKAPQVAREVVDQKQITADNGGRLDRCAEAVFPDDFTVARDTSKRGVIVAKPSEVAGNNRCGTAGQGLTA